MSSLNFSRSWTESALPRCVYACIDWVARQSRISRAQSEGLGRARPTHIHDVLKRDAVLGRERLVRLEPFNLLRGERHCITHALMISTRALALEEEERRHALSSGGKMPSGGGARPRRRATMSPANGTESHVCPRTYVVMCATRGCSAATVWIADEPCERTRVSARAPPTQRGRGRGDAPSRRRRRACRPTWRLPRPTWACPG